MGFCKKNYIFLEIVAIFTKKSQITKKEEEKNDKLAKNYGCLGKISSSLCE